MINRSRKVNTILWKLVVLLVIFGMNFILFASLNVTEYAKNRSYVSAHTHIMNLL